MADKVTGLGMLVDDLEVQQGEMPLLITLYNDVAKDRDGAQHEDVLMGDVELRTNFLYRGEESLCAVDDMGYEKLAAVLSIPTPYLMRLNTQMRQENINYWLQDLADKSMRLFTKNGELIDIQVGTSIELLDVLGILQERCDGWKVFQVQNKTNAVMVDILDCETAYDTERDTYYGGLRVIVPKKLIAPSVSTIFLNVNSCAIVNCGMEDPIGIKGLEYQKILDLIASRVDVCVSGIANYFKHFMAVAGGEVKNPRHRVALLCREHGLPDRIRVDAMSAFDDSGLQKATYEDMIDLFSSLMYAPGVKGASAMKLQGLAGYIMMMGNHEHRCGSCDAVIVADD